MNTTLLGPRLSKQNQSENLKDVLSWTTTSTFPSGTWSKGLSYYTTDEVFPSLLPRSP